MSSQQHQDSYAWTWEPAAATLLGMAVVALLSAQAGRSLALLLAGSGWHWPATSQLIGSTGGILTGDLGAGLDYVDPSGGSAVVAQVLAVVIFTSALLAALIPTARWAATRRYRGMASTVQAHQLLGIGHLRTIRAVVRPDLYRKEPR